MSLNIRKAKTINNLFTKLSKTTNMIQGHGYQSNLKNSHKHLTKKENILDYLKSFLTQRKPFLIKENNFLIKERNRNNYLSTLPTQRDIVSPANLKSRGIFDLNTKIKYRNSFKINQINSVRYKNSSKIFYKNINYKNYSNKIKGFSPSNKYKLIKLYRSLHMLTPCLTKQPNLEKDFKNFEQKRKKDEIINKEINIDSHNDKLKKNKADKNIINNEYKKENEINFYKVQNVNSFQLVNRNRNRNNDVIINNKYKMKEKNDLEENSLKEKIINGDTPKTYLEYLKIQKIKNVLKNNEPKAIYVQEKNDNDITFNLNNGKKEKNSKNKRIVEENNNKSEYYIKNEELDINSKYNKINIMGNCLNKLFFDYSDGNYPNTSNYNYLKGDNQDKNIIINKEIIINKKMENIKKNEQYMPIQLKNELISSDFEKEEKNIAHNSPKKKEKVNKNNKVLVPNQINRNNFIENKENINTENIKKPRNQVLYMDNEMQNNKINRSTIKNESNNKKNDEIIPDKNKSYLKEMNNINLNLNYLLENKNFVNIQLLSNIHKAKKNNPKKIIPPNNNFYKNSKVTKSPQSNLDFLLDRVPRHEKIFDDKNYIRSHSVKNSTINNEILRRNKIVEYISKNSSIMPPNDYNVSTHLISYY